jgi:hypothetical protein
MQGFCKGKIERKGTHSLITLFYIDSQGAERIVKMKYFTVKLKSEDKEHICTKKISLVNFIRNNITEIEYIRRYWWSGDDLIECNSFKPEEIILTKASQLKRGHTAQWAAQHNL